MSTVVTYNPNLPWSTEFLLLEEDGTPIDLSGASFRMHVRETIEADEILAESSTTNGKIAFSALTITYNEAEVSGVGIKISLSAADTLAMYRTGKKVVSDVELTFPGSDPIPEIVSFVFNPNLSTTRDF